VLTQNLGEMDSIYCVHKKKKKSIGLFINYCRHRKNT